MKGEGGHNHNWGKNGERLFQEIKYMIRLCGGGGGSSIYTVFL